MSGIDLGEQYSKLTIYHVTFSFRIYVKSNGRGIKELFHSFNGQKSSSVSFEIKNKFLSYISIEINANRKKSYISNAMTHLVYTHINRQRIGKERKKNEM